MQKKDEIENYYAILNISENAPQEVVRAAFKALAQKFHPDKSSGSPDSERLMKAINEAYQTLGNVKSREEYDERLMRSRNSSRHTQSPSEPTSPPPPAPPPSQAGSQEEEESQAAPLKIKKPHFDFSFWFSCIVSFATYKLFGLIGGLSSFAIYFILQNRIGKLQAAVAGLFTGILIATAASMLITKTEYSPPMQSEITNADSIDLAKTIPSVTTTENTATEARKAQEAAHFSEISKQHPDFEAIINTKDFSDWFYRGTAAEVDERKKVYQSGSAQDVNAMLSAYKKFDIKQKKEQELSRSLSTVRYRLAYSPYPISPESQRILDQIADEVLLTYPILRRADGQRLLDAVITRRNHLINQGITPAQAVNDAVQAVMRPTR